MSVRVLLGVLLVPAVVAACDDAPPAGPSDATPTIRSVSIVGPDSIEPGGMAQYTALLRLSDGTTQAPASVAWTSSAPALLSIDAAGAATAQPPYRGDAVISAEVATLVPVPGAHRASRDIVVLPAGTFRMAGRVTEADTPARPVMGARLEARTDEDLAAPIVTFATTDASGGYRIYGVPSDAYLHLRKPGYVPTTTRVHLEAHAARDFALGLDADRLSLAGAYTMTVDAGPGCNELPLLLRHRTYGAVLAQSGAELTVSLSEATFVVGQSGLGQGFGGVATPSGADIQITGFRDFYYYPTYPRDPSLAEMLPDGTVLVVNGRGLLSASPSGLSGIISGGITQYQYSGSFPGVRYLAGCYGGTRVTLTPR